MKFLIPMILAAMIAIPAQAAEVRIAPAAGAAFLVPEEGDVTNLGAIGASVEILAALDTPGKNWLGFGGGYDGTRLAGADVRYYLGLGTPTGGESLDEYLSYPFYLGISGSASFLDPSADVDVSELTIMAGPGIFLEIPLPGTDTFSATLGASYQFRLSGDERYKALVPVVLDIPASF